jgi:hypothetical protein
VRVANAIPTASKARKLCLNMRQDDRFGRKGDDHTEAIVCLQPFLEVTVPTLSGNVVLTILPALAGQTFRLAGRACLI